MRVCIIGCGSIGTRHARNIQTLGHQPILFDTDIEKARKADCGVIATYSDVRACLENWAKWIDAVVICTPASTHATVAQQLLNAGYRGPLFVEKPLALSVEDAEVFTRWPHPTTMVGYMLRHHFRARWMWAAYRIPIGGMFYVHSDMSQWPGRAYADPLLEYSHEIDLALWMGAPVVVTMAERSDSDMFFMLGEWSVIICWTSPISERRWEVWDGSTGHYALFNHQHELGDQMYVEEMKHFLDCAQRGVPTETPFADGIRVLDVIAQVEAMTRTHA